MRLDRQKLLAVAASIAMTAAILASQAYLVESSPGVERAGAVTIGQMTHLPVSRG